MYRLYVKEDKGGVVFLFCVELEKEMFLFFFNKVGKHPYCF